MSDLPGEAPVRPAARRRGCGGCLGSVLFGLDVFVRLTFALVALLVLSLALALLWPEPPPRVPEGAALVVAPSGLVVEELSGAPFERAIAGWLGQGPIETRLRDLVEAIEQAAEDDDVAALLLDLDGLLGAGPSKLAELADAIDTFRAAGKPVIASADVYTRSRYRLAAHADEVFLHDLGAVLLDGYSVYRTYLREGLERLGVEWNVFRVGDYKSAVETYERDGMSPEAADANLAWLSDLWDAWLDDVSDARGLAREALEAFAVDPVAGLEAAGGDSGRAALDAGLVDRVAPRDAVRDRMVELVGEDGDHGFRQIDHRAYLRARGRPSARSGDAVGVVVARGTIVPGVAPPGTVGGDSTARLVRRARHDDRIKALVLRIDSGGGSAFASEVVRRELELVRAAGKPVVVSMSSVAASGGYWIALAADEVWAHPETLTGSIGIYAYFPTFERPLERLLGMRIDGVGTTPLAGRVRPDLALPEDAATAIRLGVEHGYRQFIERVAAARDMEVAAVEEVAGGRVWSGADALDEGLVDHLGGFDAAVRAAAARAGLDAEPPVRFIAPRPTWRDQLVDGLLGRAWAGRAWAGRAWAGHAWAGHASAGRAWTGDASAGSASTTVLAWQLQRLLDQHAELLAAAHDPRGLIAHCLCGVE